MTQSTIDRSTPSGEVAFRHNQKIEEVRTLLAKVPTKIDGFLNSPKWKRNRIRKNLVLESMVTIFPQDGAFNWSIAGGKVTWGGGGFQTEIDAQRNVWEAMQRIVSG